MNILQQYIEIIFIENFIIDLILLNFVKLFTKQKLKILNIICAALIGSIYACFMNFYSNILSNSLCKILLCIITIYIAFVPKEINKFIKLIIYYYLIYFCYIGTIISLTLVLNIDISNIILKVLLYAISAIISYLLIKFLWKIWKLEIKKNDLLIKIKINNIEVIGFVDTGNNVGSSNKIPVIFVKGKLKNKIQKFLKNSKNKELEISTINGTTTVNTYYIDEIRIYRNKYEYKIEGVRIVFSDILDNFKYDALVGYDFYFEKLGGGVL